MTRRIWILLSDYTEHRFLTHQTQVMAYRSKRKARKAMERYIERKKEQLEADNKKVAKLNVDEISGVITTGTKENYEAWSYVIFERRIK